MTVYDEKAMAKVVNRTNMPSDKLLSVTPGALAYRGFATAITLAGEDVILMASSMVKLANAFDAAGGSGYDPAKAHPVVLTRRDFAQLDDEL